MEGAEVPAGRLNRLSAMAAFSLCEFCAGMPPLGCRVFLSAPHTIGAQCRLSTFGIECDGATYHGARSVRERDRLRQEILEKYGWKLYRIWSTDWFRNPNLQTRQLLACLRELHLPLR